MQPDHFDLVVVEPDVIQVAGSEASTLARLWGVSDQAMLVRWMEMRDLWLAAPKGKNGSNSLATRRGYERASALWLQFLTAHAVYPWEARTDHCRAWVAWMQASGASEATVAQRVAAVSSWYTFVINEKRYAPDGGERCLFEDGRGVARENPFRTNNFRRPQVDPFDKAHLLPLDDLNRMFAWLLKRADTLTGSRNYALLLGHAMIGLRASEFCRLTWGDIEPNWEQPGSYVFKWQGKGSKSAPTQLPEPVYHAILAYLKRAGRWLPGHPDHIQRSEFIFPPLATAQLKHLRNAREGKDYSQEHITAKNVQRIFQSSLRQAGVADWKQYRIHDLRHTLAVLIQANGGDLHYIQNLLHHSSLSTTEIYLRDIRKRMVKDKHSAQLMQQIGLPLVIG
jgi:site-specific recombinase XerD